MRLVIAAIQKRSPAVRDPRVEVMLNLMLLKARSAREAIQKAQALGRAEAKEFGQRGHQEMDPLNDSLYNLSDTPPNIDELARRQRDAFARHAMRGPGTAVGALRDAYRSLFGKRIQDAFDAPGPVAPPPVPDPSRTTRAPWSIFK